MYRELSVWQKSMELAEKVYNITKLFPKCELFSLTSQIRRCAVSVPSNIAEGRGRQTKKDFLKFLTVARGSVYELQTQLELSVRVGYIDKDMIKEVYNLSVEVSKMLNGMIKKLSLSIE